MLAPECPVNKQLLQGCWYVTSSDSLCRRPVVKGVDFFNDVMRVLVQWVKFCTGVKGMLQFT